MKIVLDTNFLIDCVRFKLDIRKELAGSELYTVESVMPELARLARSKSKESPLAKISMEFVKGIEKLQSLKQETDDSMIEYSRLGYVIATHDGVLKGKIRAAGGKVIYIRQRRYVSLE
jgi:rRNA-processing protein FCF1